MMKRFLVAFLMAILFASAAEAQSQLTRSQLESQINSTVFQNGVGAVTAAGLNTVLNNSVASSILFLSDLGTNVSGALSNALNAANGIVSVPNTDSCIYQNSASAVAECDPLVSAANGGTGTAVDTNNSIGLSVYSFSDGTSNQQQLKLNGANTFFGGFFGFGEKNTKGYQAFIGYSDTNSLVSPTGTPQSTAGGYFIAENNYSGGAATPNAYGNYTEGRAQFSGLFTTGHESDCENTSAGTDSIISTPNNIFGASPGIVCFGQWLYTGGTKSPTGKYDVSAAIGIQGIPGALNSDAEWKKGIVFGDSSIRSIGGHSEAIDLAQNYEIDWYGATDATVLRTYSDGTTWFDSGNIQLTSSGVVEWNGDTGLSRDQAAAIYVGNGTAGDSSGAIVLAAVYASSEINGALGTTTPAAIKATTINFNGSLTASGAFTANGTTALSLTNLGPSGAHSTVQKWFTVSDGTNTFYIPAF